MYTPPLYHLAPAAPPTARETRETPMPAGLAQRLASPELPTREQALEAALRKMLNLTPWLAPRAGSNHEQQVLTWQGLVEAERNAAHVLSMGGERS